MSMFPAVGQLPTDREDADARGSFTVTHKKLGADEPLNCKQPLTQLSKRSVRLIGRWLPVSNMEQSLAAGDQVVFTYENADAPSTIGASTFVMYLSVQIRGHDG